MIDEKGDPIQISQQGFERYPKNKFNFRGENSAIVDINSTNNESLLRMGGCKYSCYTIHSEQGASGSPIWNNKNQLLGINHGGLQGWTSVATPEQIEKVIQESGW